MNLPGLLERHDKQIKGTLSCFDRLVFFGNYTAIGWPGAMEQHLSKRSVRLLDYQKGYANTLRLQMHERIKRVAREQNLPILQTNHSQRKETLVGTILEKRGRLPGIVCILAAMESCRTYKVGKNHDTGYLQLQQSPGKCLHYYVYFIDEHYGLGYLRIPTWAPFRLQAYINAHDWLERRMKQAGITCKKNDNCFTQISDIEAAQKLALQLDPATLHATLNALAARLVAVHERFAPTLHWSIRQAEWSTDILFKNPAVLGDIYRQITRTAAIETNCQDIYRFMGKRPHARSKAEVATRLQTLPQGTRIKHTLGSTSLKMYDKAGSVLRIECVTNDISAFTHYRQVEPSRSPSRKPKAASAANTHKHAPMRKTLYNLPALAEAMTACNRRYLEHISQWTDQTDERHRMGQISATVREAHGRTHRAVNFFRDEEASFMQALLRGENQISGLRNRTLQAHLPHWKPAKIGRSLRRYRALGLLKTVAGTRKYYPTKLGQKLLVAGLQLKERLIIPAFAY